MSQPGIRLAVDAVNIAREWIGPLINIAREGFVKLCLRGMIALHGNAYYPKSPQEVVSCGSLIQFTLITPTAPLLFSTYLITSSLFWAA